MSSKAKEAPAPTTEPAVPDKVTEPAPRELTPAEMAAAQRVFERLGHDPEMGFMYLVQLDGVEAAHEVYDHRPPAVLFKALMATKRPRKGPPGDFHMDTGYFAAEAVTGISVRLPSDDDEEEGDDDLLPDDGDGDGDGLIPFPSGGPSTL